jgi:hypothetical protein
MIAKMPVIILGSIGLYVVLQGMTFIGGGIAILGLAITTIMESAGKVHSDRCGSGSDWDA